MGDTEFDSFFEETPAEDTAPATEDPFAAGGDAPETPAEGGFDFGGEAAQVGDAPSFESAPDMSNDMSDMSSAFVTSANLQESAALT